MERVGLEYRPVDAAVARPIEPAIAEPTADFARLAGIVRRQYLLAVAGALLAVLLAVAYLSLVEPSYRSSIRILLDQDRTRLMTEISGEQAPTSISEYIATQIAVISSDIVARRAIQDLRLTYDADAGRLRVAPAERRTAARVTNTTSEDLAAADIDPAVIQAVTRNVAVYQVGESLVIEIAANDPDPALAQTLAEAYGRAYLTDQLSARFEATKSAGSWLEERISTLRQQSLEANAAVERFRAEKNLVSTDGRLVSDQQLGSLNEQLVAARSAVTRTGAKVAVFEEAVGKGDVNGILSFVESSTDVSETAPIRTLRNDYLQASGRAAEVAARWGADNDQARALQAEGKRLTGLILDEARRILDGYRSEYRVAQSEVDAILAGVASATGQFQADNTTLVALRSLEQRSASYNGLYQDYLARYQEAVQQQTLSLTTGRLISKPDLPTRPVFPNKKIVLALSLLLGLGAGGAVGAARELLDRTFRDRSDVERQNADFLGYVARSASAKARRIQRGRFSPSALLALAGEPERWAAALATLRIALEIRRRGRSKVVGFIALQPSLLKSAAALAFANGEARAGRRVLLVDADASPRSLSATLAPKGGRSFLDVLSGEAKLAEAVTPLESGVQFLAAAPGVGAGGTVPLVEADQLEAWRSGFDLVVVDLPPAGPISEARALAPSLDGYVCVVEWRRTPRDLLRGLLQSSPVIEGKLIGALIADVNMAKLRRFDARTELHRA